VLMQELLCANAGVTCSYHLPVRCKALTYKLRDAIGYLYLLEVF
jgi:hypothetical protein